MSGSRVSLDDDYISGLAQGSIFVAFGSDLGPPELVHGAIPYATQLPSEPGGTRVTFRSIESGKTFQAYLIHSSATQVAGIIPSDVPLGFAEVRVSYDGMESDPTLVGISDVWVGLFTVSQNGRGPGAIQNYESPSSQPLNSLSRPAAPGQYLTLWGTGLGAIDGPDNVAPSAVSRDDVMVRFGSGYDTVSVPAEYAGRSPEFPGVDQINVRILDDGSVELGCYTQVTVEAGIHSGPSVDVAISDTPGECDHPWGLSAEKQAALDHGETVTFFELLASGTVANARAANANTTGVALNLGYRTGSNPGLSLAPACSSGQFATLGGGPAGDPYFEPLPPGLSVADLGELRLVGPDLRAVQLERNPYDAVAFRAKAALADDFYIPGEWTLRSSGGKDVASFETTFRVAPLPPFALPASVSASADLEFSWDVSLYQPGESVEIYVGEANPGQRQGNSVSCYAPASIGAITIGKELIASLEAETGSKLRWQILVNTPTHIFAAPGLDHGQISAQSFFAQEANFVE